MKTEYYNDMMKKSPIIDKTYLYQKLKLESDEEISEIEVVKVIESNTALVIKLNLKLKKKGHSDSVMQLFIKTINQEISNNSYHHLSLREVEFYNFIQGSEISNLPIAHCYDAYISPDKLKHLLLLEDISNRCETASDINLNEKNHWYTSACSLAKLQATFWNSDSIRFDLSLREIDVKINTFRENALISYEKFISYNEKRLDSNVQKIIRRVIDISINLKKEDYVRRLNRNNVTLKHGDAHIHNFMFPKQTNTLPMIIDFQFWSFGIGIGDLAHLTRVSLPEDFDIDCHTTLVKKYHETLLLNGVIDYTWETCWNDYRKHVACMMLIPMWQYCSFNLGYEKWCDDMPILVKNYRILECDNLLKIKDLED